MGNSVVRAGLVGVVLMALVGAVPACGDDPVRSHDRIELRELGIKVADALCDSLEPCCGAADTEFDSDECWYKVSSHVSAALRFDTDKVEYDDVAAAVCLKELEGRASCDQLSKMLPLAVSWVEGDFALEKSLPGSCRSVFSGKVSLGEECKSRFECQNPKDNADVDCIFDGDERRTCQRYQSPDADHDGAPDLIALACRDISR